MPIAKAARASWDDSNNLDAARESVADAASVAGRLWLTYLGLMVYIILAVGAVTHRDLLLENPVRLPFLGEVLLPLVAFFILGPFVFIVLHAYTLVHFGILATKIGAYNETLSRQAGSPPQAERAQQLRLPADIFVQLLAGPTDLRGGVVGFFSTLIAGISLVLGPIFLLLLVQVKFLPLHDSYITWLHRAYVAVDLAILWLLWPSMVSAGFGAFSRSATRFGRWRAQEHTGARFPQTRLAVALLATFAVIGASVATATFPGEWLDASTDVEQSIPPDRLTACHEAQGKQDKPKWTLFHDWLLNGDYDETSQTRKSFSSNTLVLPGFASAPESSRQSIVRKGRDFERAIFQGADLRTINLENAQLQHVNFYQANLQGAQLYNAILTCAVLYQAKLQGASLDEAHLENANLEQASLEGSNLFNARLEGALLKGANLSGATLKEAHLKGADLRGASIANAQLEGADLSGADLRGASLTGSQLQGANLGGARLEGAWLQDSNLEGASLEKAKLQGAALPGAQLSGTSLKGASLQGADFSTASLDGADLDGAAAWRANFEGAKGIGVLANGLTMEAISKEDFVALRDAIIAATDNEQERKVRVRLSVLDPGAAFLNPGGELRERGEIREAKDMGDYQKVLADRLEDLACLSRKDDAVSIVRGLSGNGRIGATGSQAHSVVAAILGANCAISAGLSDDDRKALSKAVTNAQAGERRD
jgi:uncharacterized protein YjbI with pentapeptide repeats